MIILASNSPRRREILADLGVEFRVLSADTDESCDITDPVLFAEELARRKGEAAYRLLVDTEGEELAREAVIISADTVVAAEGEILGKPRDASDAHRMLSLLSGRTHSVITGIGVTANGVTYVSHSNTKVVVDDIPLSEIERYVASGDPMDKAGAYGIQSGFSRWVRGIDGCYFGVVGLPVNALNKLYFEVTGKWL
jgi:septum formation protein